MGFPETIPEGWSRPPSRILKQNHHPVPSLG
jgi:hypothetical protein